jgi:hypothetical protein
MSRVNCSQVVAHIKLGVNFQQSLVHSISFHYANNKHFVVLDCARCDKEMWWMSMPDCKVCIPEEATVRSVPLPFLGRIVQLFSTHSVHSVNSYWEWSEYRFCIYFEGIHNCYHTSYIWSVPQPLCPIAHFLPSLNTLSTIITLIIKSG